MTRLLPDLADPPTPGEYLARRRQAALLTVAQVADRVAALPWARVPASPSHRAQMTERLTSAETGGWPFTRPQAALLRQIFRFDVDVYLALADLAAAGPDSGQPVPQICLGCGCSWHDPCVDHAGHPCAWSDSSPGRCSACTACETATATPAPALEAVQ